MGYQKKGKYCVNGFHGVYGYPDGTYSYRLRINTVEYNVNIEIYEDVYGNPFLSPESAFETKEKYLNILKSYFSLQKALRRKENPKLLTWEQYILGDYLGDTPEEEKFLELIIRKAKVYKNG